VLIAHIRRDILHYPPDRANVYSWKTVAEKMMSVQAQLEALIPVAVAMVLSGLIGLNREWRRSPAGIRTHMLVGMGAALVMVLASDS
jgi:hypothetical protein